MADSNEDSVPSVEDLRRMIQDCRHGGPHPNEQTQPYFQATQLFMANEYTPLDLLLRTSSQQQQQPPSLDAISSAIQQTVELVTSDPVFNQMRASPSSARFVGAIAVDAWFSNDLPNVKSFLIKGLLIDTLIKMGPSMFSISIHDDDNVRRLARRCQQILQGYELKSELQLLTRGACPCVHLSEGLQELSEENNNPAAQQARKQREIDQLPPLLKPGSQYLKIKERAAAELKANRLQASIKLYTQALGFLEDALSSCLDRRQRAGRFSEGERKLTDECSRIESNLSMIYASKLKDYSYALEHANKSVAQAPSWPKAHSRRAVALEGLGRLHEAEAAIANAMECLEQKYLVDDPTPTMTKTRAEYQKIASRIEAALEQKPPGVDDDLVDSVRKLTIKSDYTQAGAFTGCWETGVLDRIAIFLSPRDMANLEQTCRGFAAQPERMRRYALSAPLWQLCHKHEKVGKLIEVYCSENLQQPQWALRSLMVSVLALVPVPSRRRVPSWLDCMLKDARVDARNNLQSVCIATNETSWRSPLSVWAFENASSGCHDLLMGPGEGQELLPIFQKDDDSQMLRIIAWVSPLLGDQGNSHPQLREIREQAFVIFNNLISRGVDRRTAVAEVGQSSPTMVQTMALSSIFSESFPQEWPCARVLEREWNFSMTDIEGYFHNKAPRVLRRWITALQRLRQWTENGQQHQEESVLVFLVVVLENLHRQGSVDVNPFTVGLFAIKKAIQVGGSNNLRLQSAGDLAEFISDFYAWIRLYNVSLPKVRDWRDRSVAQRNMMMDMGTA